MIKAIIIEDELVAQEVLTSLIELSFQDKIDIQGHAQTVKEGIDLIQTLKPDLVFLDIELTYATGFDLLEQLDQWDFQLIFCTAYDQYAIKAFKFSAIDYLLKPIDPDELEAAVNRALSKIGEENHQLQSLMDNRKITHPEKKWLPVHSRSEVTLIRIEEIIRIESDGSYSDFFLEAKPGKRRTKLTASKKIGEYEEILTECGFFRTHNSHLINLSFLERYTKAEAMIHLSDGAQVPLARSRKGAFEAYLASL